MRKAIKKKIIKKNKTHKRNKVRKKRVTPEEAFNNGYAEGYQCCKGDMVKFTLEVIDRMIEGYNSDIERYPRNTKFVELQLDSVTELREKLIYSDEYAEIVKKTGQGDVR